MLHTIHLEKEYIPLAHDLLKFTIMFIVINVLMFVLNGGKSTLFSDNYMKIMMFTLLGVATYWLLVRNLVHIKEKEE